MSKTLFLIILFSTTAIVLAAPVPHNFPQDSLSSLNEMLHALPSTPDHIPAATFETFRPPSTPFDTPFTPPSSPPQPRLPSLPRIGRSDSAPTLTFPRLSSSSSTRRRLDFHDDHRWQLEQLKAEIRQRLYRSESSTADPQTGIRAPPNSPERDQLPTNTTPSTRPA